MSRILSAVCTLLLLAQAPVVLADGLKGDYLETRTCDVYTGPCFANGQVGLTGNDAMMAWNIERGSFEGVELAGLKVVVVTTASDTLGFGGTLKINPQNIRSLVIVDEKADRRQRNALVNFAAQFARHAGKIVKVVASPIEMSADHFAAAGTLKAGDLAEISTRKLHKGDCVCSNEVDVLSAAVRREERRAGLHHRRQLRRPGPGHPLVQPRHPQRLPGQLFVLVARLHKPAASEGSF